jgi:hypothetical protein
MKKATAQTIIACLLFLISGYMAIKGYDGWGWFLFIGLLVLT